MPSGLPGVDSDVVVTHQIGNETLQQLSRDVFGRMPAFWGRYFKRPHDSDSQLYHASIESPALSQAGIRVLPISQHTSDVGGGQSTGQQEAHSDVDAILEAFPVPHLQAQGNEFLVFLDVEPGHDLSIDYYTGWSNELLAYSAKASGGAFKFLPALYSNRANSAWKTASKAVAHGATCAGWWVAGWFSQGGCIPLGNWNDSMAVPHGIPAPSPVMIWQYSNDCHGGHGFDCNQTNPSLDAQSTILARLIAP